MFVFFSHSPVRKENAFTSVLVIALKTHAAVLLLATKLVQKVCRALPQMKGFSLKDSICSMCAVFCPYYCIFHTLTLYLISHSCLPLVLENSLQRVVLVKLVLFRIKFQWLDKTLAGNRQAAEWELCSQVFPWPAPRTKAFRNEGVCPLWVFQEKRHWAVIYLFLPFLIFSICSY